MLSSDLLRLKDRFLFLLVALCVYRFGSYIPLPYINIEVLQSLFNNNSGLWSAFDVFAGGNLSRMTIFALGLMPYISSSIIMQLASILIPKIESIKKEGGEVGIKKINQYTRYLTVFIAFIQGIVLASVLEKFGAVIPGQSVFLFKLLTAFTLLGGTVFLMWLGEQINLFGLGEGISIIIFAGIVSEIPNSFGMMFSLHNIGAISTGVMVFSLFLAAASICLVVFFESSYRMIPIQYPKHQANLAKSSYLPIKINVSGAIPAIFASSFLVTFIAIVSFFAQQLDLFWLGSLAASLNRGTFVYLFLYVSSIIFFCFFYTAISFNVDNTADNLKQYGSFIPGIRPGVQTASYLDYVVTRVTVIGAIYVSLVCIIPELFMLNFSIPFYFLNGTAILILVNVIIDTSNSIQSYIYSYQYESLIKKSKLFRKR